MKPVKIISMIVVAIVAVFLFGCPITKRRCTVMCQNGGICQHDTCICPSGYEGKFCQRMSRLKFTGDWVVDQNGSKSGQATYPASIVVANDTFGRPTNVLIKNFNNNFDTPILATVWGDSIMIPQQDVDSRRVSGQGYYHNDSITMRYRISDSTSAIPDDFGMDTDLVNGKPAIWHH